MKDIKLFSYEEKEIRTVVDNDGNPWFVGKDIANVLGYIDVSDAIRRHCKNANKISQQGDSPASPPRNILIINEYDVYRLIMRSNLPDAEKFQDWVVEEVLPSIRKTGGYIIEKPEDTPEEIMARALLVAQDTLKRREERIKQLETKVEEDKPLVEFASKVSLSTDAIDVGLFAKIVKDENINLGRNKLFKWFKENKYLMDNNEPYQEYIDRGYFKVIEQTFNTPYGNKLTFKTLILPRGQMFFINKLRDELIY